MSVRIVSTASDGFAKTLGSKIEEIQGTYRDVLRVLTRTADVKVMMGDSTVKEQSTFDPALVEGFYSYIAAGLERWDVRDVETNTNEDLRRIFTKFETRSGNYLLSGHMSVQFHVLLYYRPDYRVVECQKELAEIARRTEDSEAGAAEIGEGIIAGRLKELGYGSLDSQGMFEVLYRDDGLREKILGDLDDRTDADVKELGEKRSALLGELDGLLMETYSTTDVLIDDTRLVSGEEGILCTFDLEYVRRGTREGLFDPRRIPAGVRDEICHRLDGFLQLLKEVAQTSQRLSNTTTPK